MNTGERWLLLIVFAPLAIVTVTVIILSWHQWRHSRQARKTNRRLNRLE